MVVLTKVGSKLFQTWSTFYVCVFLGLVFNQTFEDNEMMKKLLLCSESSHQDIANDNTVNEDDDDNHDVVVESQSNRDQHPLKKLYCDVENLNQKNFNYDVIVHFVRQGELKFSFSVNSVVDNCISLPYQNASAKQVFLSNL